jgi:hypothetical protein
MATILRETFKNADNTINDELFKQMVKELRESKQDTCDIALESGKNKGKICGRKLYFAAPDHVRCRYHECYGPTVKWIKEKSEKKQEMNF